MSNIRQEVMATLINFMREARAQGLDDWKAAEQRFPGTPAEVIAEAWGAVNDEEVSRWWASVERTIEGEVVRNAIVKAGSAA
ncbi:MULTISPECIES: hypothetical protein [unclassified Chelatococcus]|uniref:hypothetical protein n=1 Tax=unclassified Chelatococcus TaxID=2638111 RepID=UPI001BCABF5E|nr:MULTISPECIES: hypothetical protein [unclassified Chelatococcus]MBS7696291.1 hypothetical protein [Chelatococcus sp. YT9]MBX3556900.1 hypothetical protein [Chelatococcus sp.]